MVSRFRSRLLQTTEASNWFPQATRTRLLDVQNNANMVLLVDTGAPGATTTVTLPLFGTVNCIVDWGDDLSDTYTTSGNKTHTYATSGKYTIRIRGQLTTFGSGSTKPWLVGCTSFGNLGLVAPDNGFRLSVNLIQAPKYLSSGMTTFNQMFAGSTAFNGDITRWKTGSVTNMVSMFSGASSFNQNISAWDVGNVTQMQFMFLNASPFNQPLGSWNVSNVTSMESMFQGCTNFNQDLTSWNTSKLTNCLGMFRNTAFNQPIGVWDVKNVLSTRLMFFQTTAFNQNLSAWRLSRCTNFTEMFSGVTLSTANYDALLTGWTDFTGSGWDSGSITAFADAGGGQVTVTTSTAHGYANNHVMRITGTTNYNGSYVISNVTSTSFRITKTFVATETGTWNATLQSGQTFHGGSSKYSVGAATTARSVLTSAPYSWTITDGGQA